MQKVIAVVLALFSGLAFAECGVNMSCTGVGGTTVPPKACAFQACFQSDAEKIKYEQDNNCTFAKCSDSITEVTVEVLRQIFALPSITTESLKAIAQELTNALKNKAIQSLIDTKRKLAHFLAQVKKEVGASMRLMENLDYRASTLKDEEKGPFSYFKKHPEEADLYGRIEDKKGNIIQPANREAIANRAYADRIGNGDVASGDGWAYRGRGMIQLTGKSNYKSFTAEHNKIWPSDIKDFVKTPDLVAQETYAVRSALVYWKTHNLTSIASKGVSYDESSKITAVINKDTDSYEERYKNLEEIMKLEFFKECKK